MSNQFSKLGFPALLFATVAIAAVTTPSRADEPVLVVMDGSNVAFHAGDQIPANQQLKLDSGQSLSLIAADGRVITLKGPYAGLPAPQAATQASNIGQMLLPLVQQAGSETATPGVIRGGDAAGPNFDAWVIDTSKSGDVCVHLGTDYDLWRADSTNAAALTLQPINGGAPIQVNFDKNVSRVGVPESVTFQDGAQYKIISPSGTTTITVHTVPEGIQPKSKVTAAWFLQKNCKVQGTALLKSLQNS